jgi:hypothetical protein
VKRTAKQEGFGGTLRGSNPINVSFKPFNYKAVDSAGTVALLMEACGL